MGCLLLVRLAHAAYNAGEIMTETDSNTTNAYAEPGEETRAAARGGLVDVPFEKDITSLGLILTITCVSVVVAVVVIVGVIRTAPLGPSRWLVIYSTALGLLCCVTAAVLKYEQYRRRRVNSLLDKSANLPLAQRIGEILLEMRSGAPQKMVRCVVTQLAQECPWGTAVRIGPWKTLMPQPPIQFAFEPRRLTDLAEMCIDDSEHVEAKDSMTPLPSGVRRNMLLKGGWVLLVSIWGYLDRSPDRSPDAP